MELRSRPKPACRNTYGECNRPKLTYFQYVVHFKGYVNNVYMGIICLV